MLLLTTSGAAWGQSDGEGSEASFEDASIEALIRALSAAEPATRARAAFTLGERGDPRGVAPLVSLLRQERSADVRGWILRALDQLGTAEAREAIAQAARIDPDQRVQELAERLAGVSLDDEEREREPRPMARRAAREPEPTPSGATPYQQQSQRREHPPGYMEIRYGWGILAGTYGLGLFTGTVLLTIDPDELGSTAWKLYLPVIGPIVAATTDMRNDDFLTLSILHWVWSGFQITGLVVLALGYARQRRARRERTSELEGSGRRARSRVTWLVSPTGPAGSTGLTIGGMFH